MYSKIAPEHVEIIQRELHGNGYLTDIPEGHAGRYLGAPIALVYEAAGLVEHDGDQLGDPKGITVWCELTAFGKTVVAAARAMKS